MPADDGGGALRATIHREAQGSVVSPNYFATGPGSVLALGGSRRHVSGLVYRQALRLPAFATVIGLLTPYLYGIGPRAPAPWLREP